MVLLLPNAVKRVEELKNKFTFQYGVTITEDYAGVKYKKIEFTFQYGVTITLITR